MSPGGYGEIVLIHGGDGDEVGVGGAGRRAAFPARRVEGGFHVPPHPGKVPADGQDHRHVPVQQLPHPGPQPVPADPPGGPQRDPLTQEHGVQPQGDGPAVGAHRRDHRHIPAAQLSGPPVIQGPGHRPPGERRLCRTGLPLPRQIQQQVQGRDDPAAIPPQNRAVRPPLAAAIGQAAVLQDGNILTLQRMFFHFCTSSP